MLTKKQGVIVLRIMRRAVPLHSSLIFKKKGEKMCSQSRVALIGIVVSEPASVTKLNEYLHECAGYIIGRMGVPYEKAGVSIISVAIDAPQDVINTLSGRLGALKGVTSKTIYQKLPDENEKAKVTCV